MLFSPVRILYAESDPKFLIYFGALSIASKLLISVHVTLYDLFARLCTLY